MPKEIRAVWDWLKTPEMSAGKITLVTILSGAIVTVMTFGAYFQLGAGWVSASTGTSTVVTSVTVLNVPPVWVNGFFAHETTGSATSTPTMSGYQLNWQAKATDSNGDQYYLLICYGTSTTATPTANSSAPPTCGSGALQWAVSGPTNTGVLATASTNTIETFPFNQESNNWYAWVCDSTLSNPSCYGTYTQGEPADPNFPLSNSPFVIDHPPAFSAIATSSPALPGGSITWTATATDTDILPSGGDVLQLWVCKTGGPTGFATSSCTGGQWASSTVTHFNPATTTTITAQNLNIQDGVYNAFVYIQDTRGRQATSTFQGFNTTFTVLDATPTVSSVQLISTTSVTDLQLFRPHATSGPYYVTFIATDTNGCQNKASGNELVSATTSVYRSAMTSCTASTTMNTNMCYPSADPQTQITCIQDDGLQPVSTGDVCTPGFQDQTVGWICSVPLWYNADPTDPGSVFSAQNWLATVAVTDDNGFHSTSTPSATTASGPDLDKFLAFSVSTTSIAYGGLQPTQSTPIFTQTTDLNEWGNTGIDEMLYGDTMCTGGGWTGFGTCDNGGAVASSSQIASWNQQAATSSVAFGSGQPTPTYPLHASSSPLIINLGVQKTTSTSSAYTKNTFWGIHIPVEITQSGTYIGQDVIGAVVSNTAYW